MFHVGLYNTHQRDNRPTSRWLHCYPLTITYWIDAGIVYEPISV
jgi:hypothetical protein